MIKDDRLPLKQKFLEYYAEVPIQKYAGAHIGRDEDTISTWKKEDPDFADQIEVTKSQYLMRELKMVKNREWKLERLFKDHFAARTEITGKDGEKLESLVVVKHGEGSTSK